MLVNLRSWRISHISSYTFLLALSTLVASLGLSLGSRIVGPREPKVQMGELNTNCNSSVFLKGVMKMADVDINPFGDHNKTDAQPDESGETIPLIPGGVRGGATWEPECERETLFGGKTQRTRLKEAQVQGLYRKLSESICQTPEAFHFDNFELRDWELYQKSKEHVLNDQRGRAKISWCHNRHIG